MEFIRQEGFFFILSALHLTVTLKAVCFFLQDKVKNTVLFLHKKS